ncbi:MAG: PD40 domain-containing protein [Chloroflexi bacterium]|nr:PD40 domain-containing protein [Chloroflexota bacterium]
MSALMRGLRIVLLVFFAAAGIGAARNIVHAQEAEMPLILWSRGDLYRVNDAAVSPVKLTNDGNLSSPALSPSGQWIAYKTASTVGLEALSRVSADGLIAEFDLPADIVLFDITSGAAIPLTEQPADASLFVEGTPDRAVLRSAPVWAPDSSQLAWTEVDYSIGSARLMVYDVASAQASTLALLPAQPNRLVPLNVHWGSAGIAVDLSPDAGSDQFHVIYDPTSGEPIGALGVAAVPGNSVRLTTWVTDSSGRALLGLLYESGGWTLIDPTNNTPVSYSTLPVLKTAADGSWHLRFGVDASLGFYWEVEGSNAAATGEPNGVALSPVGNRLAVVGQPAAGVASIFDGSAMTAIAGTGSGEGEIPVGAVLWGPMQWVLGL